MKAVLSPNPYRDRGLKMAQAAQKILCSSGVDTVLCLPFDLDENSRIEFPAHLNLKPIAKELDNADVLICFGGDGTILHAAKDASARSIPILGVNMGSVGFMAELEHSELSLLTRLAKGSYETESRMMLDVRVMPGRAGRCSMTLLSMTQLLRKERWPGFWIWRLRGTAS